MKKWIIILLILLAAISVYVFLSNNHREIASEDISASTTSQKLYEEFLKNPPLAQSNYLNKTIQISGLVSNYSSMTLILEKKVVCQFTEPISEKFIIDKEIVVKGRLIGFDELLEEIKLDQCTIINQKTML